MGRQIQFHALRADLAALLTFVQRRDKVVLTKRDSDSPLVEPLRDPFAEVGLLTLWNTSILPALERELVERPGGSDYYTIRASQPTLELHLCREARWQGRDALLQGRIYGAFAHPSDSYDRWYAGITRWIRSRFKRVSEVYAGTWISADAIRWFTDGGILFPMFEPVPTLEWRDFVSKQDAARAGLVKKMRGARAGHEG